MWMVSFKREKETILCIGCTIAFPVRCLEGVLLSILSVIHLLFEIKINLLFKHRCQKKKQNEFLSEFFIYLS